MTDPIKAKIQSLCPDVMELKFGCVVHLPDSVTSPFYTRIIEAWHSPYGWKYKVVGSTVEYIEADFDEILGSDITFPVVLRAIRESGFDIGDFLNGNGLFLVRDVEGRTLEWNLLKNYDDQTEETTKFIGSLLGV